MVDWCVYRAIEVPSCRLVLKSILALGGRWLPGNAGQQVTCRTALVLSEAFRSTSIASAVGRTSNLILRRAASCFLLHFFHHWQCARSGAEHEPMAFPGDLFLHGQWGVSKGAAEFLGWLLLALA